ncbi:MAG: ankX 2 [Rickettsiaceae bacterium]|jgi:ankyrin repeat protein|nr:ankX 2 [Rickettsiaceae bacterium]
MPQKITLLKLLELATRIEIVISDPTRTPFSKDETKKGSEELTPKKIEELKKNVNFSPIEKEIMLEHKEFFRKIGDPRLLKFLGEEPTQYTSTAINNDGKAKLERFLQIAIELRDESQKFPKREFTSAANKIYSLCDLSNDPQQTIKNAREIIKIHANSAADYALHDFFLFNLPSSEKWNKKGWNDLILKSSDKGIMRLLQRADVIEEHLRKVPTSYKEALDTSLKISYPRAKEIYEIDESKLSPAINKDDLKRFTELCNKYAIKEEDYNKGLDVLLYSKLKTKDNLPDIIIDGKELSDSSKRSFSKYYMAKLPAGDPRGLLLGELTNCCQSIGNEAKDVAIDGMTSQNSGFYIICEKGKDGKIDIKNDRIVAQSYVWLGQPTEKGGKTLVFDSWERLGKDNDKLLDPFYSKFADEVGKHEGIAKVSIGAGGNTPIGVAFQADPTPTKFKGVAPYSDAEKQCIILDKEREISPYDEETDKRRFNLPLLEAVLTSNNAATKKLLEEGYNPNTENKFGFSILAIAFEKDNKDLLKPLLDSGANPNAKNQFGNPILADAFLKKDINIASLLLEKGANPNTEIKSSGIPILVQATIENDKDFVRLLKDKGAQPLFNNDKYDPFIAKAIEKKNKELITFLMYKRDNPKGIDKDIFGNDCLVNAIKNNDKDLVGLLLEKGANPDTKDDQGIPMLLKAISTNNEEFVNLLKDKGAQTIYSKTEYDNFLYKATLTNDRDLMIYLLEQGASPDTRDYNGIPILINAEATHDEEFVKLIKSKGAITTYSKEEYDSFLKKAINTDNKELIIYLVEKGASPDTKDRNGIPLLMKALQENDDKLIKLLKEKNAKATCTKEEYDAFLAKAIEGQLFKGDNKEIISFLLNQGANPNISDSNGKPIILRAFEKFDQELAYNLLKAGANPETKDSAGIPIIHSAIDRSFKDVVSIILEKGGDPNSEDKTNIAALHKSILSGKEYITKVLLDAGAEVNAKSLDKTPLIWAALFSKTETINLLLEKGADVNIKDSAGKNAIDYASSPEIKDILEKARLEQEKAKEALSSPKVSKFTEKVIAERSKSPTNSPEVPRKRSNSYSEVIKTEKEQKPNNPEQRR